MPPDPTVLAAQIIATLRLRYKFLNQHFEAGWTESWSHRRCLHEHQTLIEAAKCGMPHGAGWYVFDNISDRLMSKAYSKSGGASETRRHRSLHRGVTDLALRE